MITLEEGEALVRAGSGQTTAIIAEYLVAKFQEICARGAQLGWTIDTPNRAIISPNGGRLVVVSTRGLIDQMRNQKWDFVAISAPLCPSDLIFVKSLVKE